MKKQVCINITGQKGEYKVRAVVNAVVIIMFTMKLLEVLLMVFLMTL